MSGRWIWAVVAVTIAAGGMRAGAASRPNARQSADERGYVDAAVRLLEDGRYGRRSLHWPPGAPAAFAAAAKLGSGVDRRGHLPDLPAAYWVQWLAGTALIPLVFALALATAASHGSASWAALAAAGLVGAYPPLVGATGDLLSEPLGALWLTAALLALVRRHHAWAGLLLAAAVLTRANLLVLVPVLVVAVALTHRRAAIAFATAAIVPLAAWSLHVGAPVTTGGGSSLFVGTYLPGGGTLAGTKRALKAETVRLTPALRGRHARDLPGARVLDAVAARHRELPRDDALRAEAWRNLRTYPRTEPARFAALVARKLPRLWLTPARGETPTPTALRAWHALLVLAALTGLLLARDRRMLTLLAAFTLFHLIAGSMPRYALPLLPALIATGAAGWATARARRPRRSDDPHARPERAPPPTSTAAATLRRATGRA